MSSAADLLERVAGDATGIEFPAHPAALERAGPKFLTRAFHAFGSLPAGNAVTRIVRAEPCPGGSTGAKLLLEVDYARPNPSLHRRLFAKFSRDFADPRRDWQRTEMKNEAPFMAVSRLPGFPIRVPAAYFADYHDATGTGLIITEQVPYGELGIEPHRRKTLDHRTMDDPAPYYRAMVISLARLAGAHRSGRLSSDIDRAFPFDPVAGSADPIRYGANELEAELQRCRSFARRCPRLLPAEIRSEAFLDRLARDARRVRDHEAELQHFLTGDPDMIALCHWNAHVDNCIFTRDAAGRLGCGFIDWGRVGRITLGSVLWGALSAAHHAIWDEHIDELLALFVAEYRSAGGPAISAEALDLHLALHMMTMGVARVLAFPEIIEFRLPGCVNATGPHDPMFEPVAADPARNCRQVYVNLLQHWRRRDFGAKLDQLLDRKDRG
jgi:hypothetical protein